MIPSQENQAEDGCNDSTHQDGAEGLPDIKVAVFTPELGLVIVKIFAANLILGREPVLRRQDFIRLQGFPIGQWGASELADFQGHDRLAMRVGCAFAATTINRIGTTEFGTPRVHDAGSPRHAFGWSPHRRIST